MTQPQKTFSDLFGCVISTDSGSDSGAGGCFAVGGDRYDYLLKYRKKNSIARPFAPDDGGGIFTAPSPLMILTSSS